jgi:transketolase
MSVAVVRPTDGAGHLAGAEALSAGLISRAYKRLLEMHFRAGVGHIGGNLWALEALLVRHQAVMAPDDGFVLAKGHAAGALYITLWTLGRISDQELDTFHQEGTLLTGHPAPGWSRDIPFATGSLGHGLPDAAGMALGYKLQSKEPEVFCLTSDGEWEEGSNWEALIFAIHRKLTNLTIVIDANRLQGFGTTGAVASMDPLETMFAGFSIPVVCVDGHDHRAVAAALRGRGQGPRIVVLKTVKDHGVSFMENAMDWHYLPLNAEQYRKALQEIEERDEKAIR